MLEKAHESQLHIYLGILLLVAGFFFAPQNVPNVKAQSVPAACSPSSLECNKLIGPGTTTCSSLWAGKTCSQIPCAARKGCGCDGCLNGCSSSCVVPPSGGGTNTPNVPNNPSDTNVPNPSKSPTDTTNPAPSGKVPPLTVECATRCDLNKDGAITKDDFRNSDGSTTTDTALLKYCTQSCPWSDGSVPNPQPSTPPTAGKLEGDCSGSVAGTPDGKVDLKDVEYYRQELNDEVTTLACDFDQSGDVDIIDFTNYLRSGFIAYNKGGNGTPSPSPVPSEDPQPSIVVSPVPPADPADPAPTLPSTNAKDSVIVKP